MASTGDYQPERLVAAARRLADDVLFPNALAADTAGVVPEMQLQCLADEGFYGVSVHAEPATIFKLIEVIASGCLTTAFTWTQHLGATAAVFHSDAAVKNELADDLVAGRTRAGVAFAHMLRPGQPMTTAEPTDTGWKFNGTAPWVTAWGHIDVVHAAARHGDDLVWAAIDAVDSPTLQSSAVDFAVVDSTQTRVLTYNDHEVPAGRVTKVEDYEEWRARYQLGLRANGSLALGVANRCCRLLNDSAMSAELNLIRDRLNLVDPSDLAAISAARADASLFAVRSATALVATTGGRAVMLENHAQRLMREAMFVLVQGQTPTIKAAMLKDLSATR